MPTVISRLPRALLDITDIPRVEPSQQLRLRPLCKRGRRGGGGRINQLRTPPPVRSRGVGLDNQSRPPRAARIVNITVRFVVRLPIGSLTQSPNS